MKQRTCSWPIEHCAYFVPVPGVEQFSPMYPAGHWHVLFGMQTPIPHGGSQTTVGKTEITCAANAEDSLIEYNILEWTHNICMHACIVDDSGR